jgi:septal ring factor EnvC (AmiA/AmiB activator)
MMRGRLALVLALAGTVHADDEARARRLKALEQETRKLQSALDALALRERGLLGEVARLDAEIALNRAHLEDASLRLDDTQARLTERESACAALEEVLARRAPYAARRVRELYKRGPAALLPRIVLPDDGGAGRDGVRYASYLARRDARQLSAWRATSSRLNGERAALRGERERLGTLQVEAARSEADLTRRRIQRAALLERIRTESRQHEQAIGELDAAAAALASLVGALDGGVRAGLLDVHKFRGLLDWPSEGKVTAGFGKVVHPRFRTELPHPGLDIDAGEGTSFRAVFEGQVAFASALHGYGLTVIVDHGHGVASVYAHAGVLLVGAGDEVARGQELGRVGDSGSLRGPYLYFEMRVSGKPEDPAGWLSAR